MYGNLNISLKKYRRNYLTLALKNGIHQIVLDKESRKLFTFKTPFGMYEYNRMPFGISSGSDILHMFNKKYFGNIENVCTHTDNLLIMGKSLEDHDRALQLVVECALILNIIFNVHKFHYRLLVIDFFSKDIPNKVTAIR